MRKVNVILPLGGGRFPDGTLTPLSIQRLDEAIKLQKQTGNPILVGGGKQSTYLSNAVIFQKTGRAIRKNYLINNKIPKNKILTFLNGVDTIGEAFGVKKVLKKYNIRSILLVTSDKHMARAKWVFKRILPPEIKILSQSVPSGDLLNDKEEKDYLKATKAQFKKLPKNIPFSTFETWLLQNQDLYQKFKLIHDKFRTKSRVPSQLYAGVR